jgi:hypothetical protein
VKEHDNGVVLLFFFGELMKLKRFKQKGMEPKKTHFVYHVVGDVDRGHPEPGEKVIIGGAVKTVDEVKFVGLLPFRQGIELKLFIRRS